MHERFFFVMVNVEYMLETLQAKIVLGLTLILLVLQTTQGYIMYGNPKGTRMLLWIFGIGIPLAILFAYDTNCLIQGKCVVRSWVRTGIFLIIAILSVVIMVLTVTGHKYRLVSTQDMVTSWAPLSPSTPVLPTSAVPNWAGISESDTLGKAAIPVLEKPERTPESVTMY